MNNITGDKMLAHIDRVFGEHKPITADVFLNNFCNNKCPYCTYRRWELEPGARSMSVDDFITYAKRMRELGVLGIILTGGGEPTVSKDFDAITQWLQDNDYHYGINTNFNVVKYIAPDYLKVSLDGWDEDSYYAHRGVRHYRKVRDNIKKYAEWKRKNNIQTSLGIQILAMSVGEVQKFYDANKDLPVDYISIRPMESTFGTYYSQLLSRTSAPSYSLPQEIIKSIETIRSIDKRVILNYKWTLLDRQESSCVAQWAQLAINELGEVMYCCHKPYQIVGHILDEDIMQKKENTSTDMHTCDIPCRMTGPNLEVLKLLSPKKDVNFI